MVRCCKPAAMHVNERRITRATKGTAKDSAAVCGEASTRQRAAHSWPACHKPHATQITVET